MLEKGFYFWEIVGFRWMCEDSDERVKKLCVDSRSERSGV